MPSWALLIVVREMIDVMVREGACPVIVGDLGDIRRLRGVLAQSGKTRAHLVMETKQGAERFQPLTCGSKLGALPVVVVVALDGKEIVFAHLVQAGNPFRVICDITPDEVKAMTEALISQDYIIEPADSPERDVAQERPAH